MDTHLPNAEKAENANVTECAMQIIQHLLVLLPLVDEMDQK